MDLTPVRSSANVRPGIGDCPCLGDNRPDVQLFRHLAAGHQYGYDHHYISDGLLIQNTQNRDSAAVQLKLDELIRVSEAARNKLLTLEDLTEAELDQLKKSFARIADQGGIGEGVLYEVEDDLDQAEEGIEKARDKFAAG